MGIKRLIDENMIVLSGFLKSFKTKKEDAKMPVDFVVCWVDGNDPEWLVSD